MNMKPPHHDPLAQQVATTRAVLWTSALVVLGAISARWWPLGDSTRSRELPSSPHDRAAASPERQRGGSATSRNINDDLAESPQHASLDLAAFDRAMWLVPAAPEVPKTASEKPAPPPPPLTLQLLGLVNDNGTTKAILYDSTTDRVRVVAVGDSIGERTIEHIDTQGVAIRDGAGVRTLALKGGAGGGGGP
ncbi:MAG: hypothetical protein JNL50_13740 [Phycisphaerae bacterium]|nr:hypothetical protein [Phycisphaerae bacterium]